MSTGTPSHNPPPQNIQPAAAPAGISTKTILLITFVVLLGGMLVCGGILAGLLIPAVGAARQAARAMQSQNNMKQIGLALHNYHFTYNSLPPAYTTDANGKPGLSWRVLILPFLESASTYQQFKLEEAWDSPSNLPLAALMPGVYQSPLLENASPDQTSYLAVRSAQSIFPSDVAVRFSGVTDGTSMTLAVVDFPNRTVTWSAPDDSSPADFYAAFQSANATVSVLFTDGSVKRMPASIPQATLDAMITRDGGEAYNLP